MSLRNFILITISLPENIEKIKYLLTPKLDEDIKKVYNRILLRNNYSCINKTKYISLYKIQCRNHLIMLIKIEYKLIGYKLFERNGMNYGYKRVRWYNYKKNGAKEIIKIKFN